MKICFICNEYPPAKHGGIGTIMKYTAEGLAARGHEVRVVGVYPVSDGLSNYEVIGGVKIWRIAQSSNSLISVFKSRYEQYKAVKKWISNKEIDIVEAPESQGWFAFWPATKVPCVQRGHGSQTNEKLFLGKSPNRLTKLLENRSYQRADNYTGISKFSSNAAEKTFHLPKPPRVVYYGIQFHQVERKQVIRNKVVFSGTLVEKKGVIDICQAANILFEKGIRIDVTLYGADTKLPDGGSMKEYLISILRPEVRDAFHFLGFVSRQKLFEEYSDAHLAVFPSHWETFGLAPIEAMMCSCPTVHTFIPTGPELIVDGKEGLLVPPADPVALAVAIEKILCDDELARELGEQGKLKVQTTFTLDRMLDELVDFYQRTCDDFNKRRR